MVRDILWPKKWPHSPFFLLPFFLPLSYFPLSSCLPLPCLIRFAKDFYPSLLKCPLSSASLQLGPDQYIDLLILSADNGLTQIHQYWCICSGMCADIKLFFKARKMLGLVISDGIIALIVQQRVVCS